AKDMTEVIQTLEQEKVPYKIEDGSGAILVPEDVVHSLRLKLAAQGYPKQAPTGYQLLDIDQGYGISQFKETTRYHRALEGELAKSVKTINAVKSARVMLGLPKRSVFVRKQQEPTASVAVQLYPGRGLSDEQVNAIVYLVSSSVPNMKPKNVTVVDQQGNLLTSDQQIGGMSTSLKQLAYTRQIEDTLSRRIIKLLSPIVGGNHKVRAQVTAELDFTQQEQTRENYEPDPEAIRSEQEIKEINRKDDPGGIPGALTNQPPRAGVAPETGYKQTGPDAGVKSSKEKKTKNYELDRTVSHIKNSVGTIQRLSVAVVIDDKVGVDENGKTSRTPLTEDELKRYRQLVSDAVGLDENRGDTLSIVNATFAPEVQPSFESPKIWEQSWFWNVVKQVLAGLAVLIIIFGVIRPMLRDLSKQEEVLIEYPENVAEEEEELENADEISKALEQMNEEVQETAEEAQADSQEDKDLIEKVKAVVAADPKVASHIIKQWMREEG
ncbi:MAG: flagellar basal-body MS-ring/collar protein FliF, partial [Hydrogenovibrio sp.]|nr:flagellar basal-body MS-ring/collar protein FliF [Hydrogenovibrio sp.]